MNYKKWLHELSKCNVYDFSDKGKCVDNKILYMFARTQSMFKYEGLPETIPARMLELYLQMNGNVCITEISEDVIKNSGHDVKPGLYAFCGGLGGELDAYYMPTIYTIANPYLNYSRNLKIDTDCIVFPSDSLYIGLLPMYQKYASALTENELSLYVAMLNTRISSLISATDDSSKKSAEKVLEDIRNGKQGVIADPQLLDGIRVQPYGNSGTSGTIQNLIELEQYYRAIWFNDLGLNANYNMKRESLNSNESQLNDDALLPLIDDMLKCRENGIKKVNEKYGTNITVSLNSSWEDNEQEVELKHDEMGGDDSIENPATEPEEKEDEPEEKEEKEDERTEVN